MMRILIERGIRGMERRLGVPLDHLREIGREAPELLPRLSRLTALLAYRRTVPRNVMHVARIGATLAQDCGPCLQIAVNVALADGVAKRTVEAAVRGDWDALEDVERVALTFAGAVATGLEPGESRDAIRDRYGDRGVIELSLAAATSQFYPVLKRGMGYGSACRIDRVRYASV